MNRNEISSFEYSSDLALFVSKRLQKMIVENHGGGSTSVSSGIAERMLASIKYVLEHGTQRTLITLNMEELESAYQAGMSRILKTLDTCADMYLEMKKNLPKCASSSMINSLQSFENSFSYYQPESNALEYPCDINYQLCCQLDAGMEGADYAYGYLSRLNSENHFICMMPIDACIYLLNSYMKCWNSVPVNLYEPIMINAIGRTLLDLPLTLLSISGRQNQLLKQLFHEMCREEIEERLIEAAERLSLSLSMNQTDQAYLKMGLHGLSYRIDALGNSNGLRHVFLNYGAKEKRFNQSVIK